MNLNTLVTIAIPIYNAEQYLRHAIQSCINQTYKNWELLLMCDGSTDRSTCIAHEMAAHDCRIRVVDDGQNKGLIYRLNQSINMAKGQLYARMDSDDIMYVTRIEEQVIFFEEHPDADVVGTSIMTIDKENNIVGSGYYDGEVTSFVHPSIMGRTTWFRNNPYADWPIRAEDMELWLRTSSHSKFYAIGKPLLFYREFGMPTFYKYLATQKTLFRVYANYNYYNKTFLWCIGNSLLTIAKIILSALFTLLGKADMFVYFRRRLPISNELQLTAEDLNLSISCDVNDKTFIVV